MKTPINNGILQSNLDFNNLKPGNADLSDYAGDNIAWNVTTKKFDSVGGGTGSDTPIYTVNVKAEPYNATGDGVTDDSAAINTAIAAVFAIGGGTVFFPRGTYLCNGAFDGTTNSILKIPLNDSGNAMVPMQLLGEVPPPWTSFFGSPTGGTIIKTTKAGTGTRPALLAGAAFHGSPGFFDFSAVMLQIRNISFQTYQNPTIDGLRLESIGRVNLSDVSVDTDDGVNPIQPTNGTVGVWMPKNTNYALTQCNRVYITGYDTGIKVSEHFSAPYIEIGYCMTGIDFETAFAPSWIGSASIVECPTDIRFSGAHRIDMMLDLEYTDTGNWYDTPAGQMIVDGSNLGTGFIRYSIVKGGVGPVIGPISVTGAVNLRFMNLFTGDVFTVATLPASPRTGDMAIVTDGTAALAWGATVTGGGGETTKYRVWYNGANWTVMGK